jgi:hypothetical protein
MASMADEEAKRLGDAFEERPHAFDPTLSPELFEGVLARRVIAFAIDVIVIGVPVVLAAIFIFLFGIATLGMGWLLYWFYSRRRSFARYFTTAADQDKDWRHPGFRQQRDVARCA